MRRRVGPEQVAHLRFVTSVELTDVRNGGYWPEPRVTAHLVIAGDPSVRQQGDADARGPQLLPRRNAGGPDADAVQANPLDQPAVAAAGDEHAPAVNAVFMIFSWTRAPALRIVPFSTSS
jgi:hypothetical protein